MSLRDVETHRPSSQIHKQRGFSPLEGVDAKPRRLWCSSSKAQKYRSRPPRKPENAGSRRHLRELPRTAALPGMTSAVISYWSDTGDLKNMPRTLSLKVIEARIAELQKKAAEIANAAKPGIKQIQTLMAKHRLTADDVMGLFGNRSTKRPGASLKGTRVAIKYRNPDNRKETWTGRGMTPKWMTAAMKEKGLAKEAFMIGPKPKSARAKKRKPAKA